MEKTKPLIRPLKGVCLRRASDRGETDAEAQVVLTP